MIILIYNIHLAYKLLNKFTLFSKLIFSEIFRCNIIYKMFIFCLLQHLTSIIFIHWFYNQVLYNFIICT